MVKSKLIWDEHINPRWVKLFDSIVAGTQSNVKLESSSKSDLARPVLRGEML